MPNNKKKLTVRQQEALDKLAALPDGAWECSYTLRASLATLDSLEKCGLVEYRSQLGSIYSPRTAIEWRLVRTKPNA